MKKSKIIVPALAVLCLSTAAAVSGTVAWFTADREASFTVNSTVINPEGDMKVELTAGFGTEVITDSSVVKMSKIQVGDTSYPVALRDASVDIFSVAGSMTAYRALIDGNGNAFDEVTSADVVTAKTVAAEGETGTTYSVVYFVQWQATFTMPDKATTEKFDIFFNARDSKNNAATTKAIDAAYRVGMYTADHQVVWAPQRTNTAINYVDSDTAGSYAEGTGTYSLSGAGVTTSAAVNKIDNSNKTNAQASNLYLGQVTGGTEGGLTVNFVAWYEGLDEACKTANLTSMTISEAAYNMAFNAIDVNSYLA